MSKASSSDIAKHAYQIWEREGRPHGRDQEHWYTAEREVLGAETAAEDRPIGEIRSAQQASERQADAAARSKTARPAAPPLTQAAAADTGRTSQVQGQVQGSQTTAKPTQSQAGQPQTQQSAQQSTSGKAAQPSGAKSQSPGKRKPRAGGKQPNP